MIRNRKKSKFFLIVLAAFILVAAHNVWTEYKINSLGCKETGEQRFKNSVTNSGDGALSTLEVEDKMVCRGGMIIWHTKTGF